MSEVVENSRSSGRCVRQEANRRRWSTFHSSIIVIAGGTVQFRTKNAIYQANTTYRFDLEAFNLTGDNCFLLSINSWKTRLGLGANTAAVTTMLWTRILSQELLCTE